MAIKNKRQSISDNSAENRLKTKLKENHKRFLKEEDEDEKLDGEDSMDMGDDAGADDIDMDLTDDMADGDVSMEDGLDSDDSVDGAELTDDQFAQVDAWVDELLSDSLDNLEVDGGESLDIETPADELDPMGAEQTVSDDLPLTADDLNNIIDSDDSLHALEDELITLATDDEVMGSIDMGDDEKEVDVDMEIEESEDFAMNENEDMMEAEDPFDGIKNLPGFDIGYEGVDRKDDLAEDIELAPDNKAAGFKKVAAGLNDKKPSGVTQISKAGDRSVEDIKKDVAGVVQESVKKAKMLVKAAAEIASLQEKVTSLKLENYRLIKANGILSVAGDKLSKEARTKISESFDKCRNIDQVNKFYEKTVAFIKNVSRPTLNEAVAAKKSNIRIVKGSEESTQETKAVSAAQERKNMLMGLDTQKDVYFDL